MPHRRQSLLTAACVTVTLFRSSVATAQEAPRELSWREPRPRESVQRFAVELRFAPYRPKIDDAFPAERPYETVFGSDRRLCFGLEFDWQLFRIPWVGTVGPGVGWGYTHMSAPALIASSGALSGAETSLAIMPMYAVGVLRLDALARETAVPLIGYAKAGLGYGLYWSGNDTSTQRRGHTWGTHFAFGGMLLLDVIDGHAATELDNEWGINNTYFFFEWMLANLDGFSSASDRSVMRIGTNTWVMGLAFEM